MTVHANIAALYRTPRIALLWVGGFALTIVIGSTALQYLGGLTPCPLCILQRALFFLLAMTAISAAFIPLPALFQRLSVALTALVSVAGIGVALRHLWVQSDFVQTNVSCGPSTGYLMDTLPFWEFVLHLLNGSGDCATVHPILGIPLPLWSLAGFAIAAGLLIAAIWPRRQ